MNEEVNAKVAEYEEHLRAAERDIERALQAVCPLRGEALAEVRKSLGDALGLVQFNIRGTFKLYDNPDIEVA
jgi:hypothetical protein